MNKNRRGDFGICFLCRKERPLIKAHILSKAFRKYICGIDENNPNSQDKRGTIIMADGSTKYTQSNNLPYMKDTFCADCDNKFSGDEKYFLEFIKNIGKGDINIITDDEEYGRLMRIGDFLNSNLRDGIINDIDLEKIRRFILFLILKLDLSEKFSHINIGPYREKIICELSSGDIEKNINLLFSMYKKFDMSKSGNTGIFSPIHRRISGINAVSIIFPYLFEVICRLDSREFEDVLERAGINNGYFALIKQENFDDSLYIKTLLSL